jgi:hypothetical protein
MGTSVPKTSRAGKEYNEPQKLERFRLTSRSRQLLETASTLYGGEVSAWTPQGSTVEQYELHIERDWLSVIVPPDPCSQYFEVWNGGRCARRCDGVVELLSDAPCLCGPDPDRRACKPYTRLALMLADMPGIGVWRLETHGYYAAAELPAVADLLSKAGGNVAARLEMEQRQQMVDDPRNAGKQITALFYVPVLHVEATPAQLLAVLGSGGRVAIGVGSDDDGPPAIEAPPAAIEPPPAHTEQPPPPPPGTTIPPQPDLVNRIITAIAGAADRNRMMTLRANIVAAVLDPADRATVEAAWTGRAQAMANAAPNEGQSATAQAAPTPQPPPAVHPNAGTTTLLEPAGPAIDRQAVFLSINTWAGYKNLGMSALAAFFKEWSQSDQDIREATGEELVAFKAWLELNK